MAAPARDDDPVHPNFDGIVFYETTDHTGVVATPASGQQKPPVSYLPLANATQAAGDIFGVIQRIRSADPQSYLADYLDDMLENFTAAIDACREKAAPS